MNKKKSLIKPQYINITQVEHKMEREQWAKY